MKKYNFLILSFFGFLFWIALLIALGCNFAGIENWRGDKAVFSAVTITLIGVSSIFTLLFQIVKTMSTFKSKVFGILLFFVLVLVGTASSGIISKQLCH